MALEGLVSKRRDRPVSGTVEALDQGKEPSASVDGSGKRIPSNFVMNITAAVQPLCLVLWVRL